MKRFLFGVILLMFAVLSESFAQSTYNAPWPGATHTYSITLPDNSVQNPVRWYVASATDGTKATYNTVYTFVTSGYSSSNDQLEGTGVYSVQITWATNVPLDTDYYVFFEMDSDGCTNKMALPVHTVANGFNAMAYNVTNVSDPANYGTDTSGGSGTNQESCPADPSNPIWNGTGHTNIGSTELIYRVERHNSNNKWNLSYALTETNSVAFTVEQVRVLGEDNSTQLATFTAASGTTATDVIDANQDYVLVYVKVANQQGTSLDINFSVANSKDAVTNTVDTNAADNAVLHTIKTMPTISGFSGT
ncbi:hypothetical protein EMN47_20220 [Prolixibacteraceae bacterium JC049]|nr:hypothetical protein [Prolixibacteraceae bacterium JC049]